MKDFPITDEWEYSPEYLTKIYLEMKWMEILALTKVLSNIFDGVETFL